MSAHIVQPRHFVERERLLVLTHRAKECEFRMDFSMVYGKRVRNEDIYIYIIYIYIYIYF